VYQRIDLVFRLRLRRADQQFVIPRIRRIRIVLADISRRRLALFDGLFPLDVSRRTLLVVEITRKG
jgi:hypothetical protein